VQKIKIINGNIKAKTKEKFSYLKQKIRITHFRRFKFNLSMQGSTFNDALCACCCGCLVNIQV
jgi:hypothetical protein